MDLEGWECDLGGDEGTLLGGGDFGGAMGSCGCNLFFWRGVAW